MVRSGCLGVGDVLDDILDVWLPRKVEQPAAVPGESSSEIENESYSPSVPSCPSGTSPVNEGTSSEPNWQCEGSGTRSTDDSGQSSSSGSSSSGGGGGYSSSFGVSKAGMSTGIAVALLAVAGFVTWKLVKG